MNNKDIISKVKVIPVYELNAIQEYLEAMAEQGLFFVKHSGMVWKFKKGDPRKVHYYVDVFDKATMFDTRPEAETIDYIEYCKSCGWEHILTEGKLQFFISCDENPVDIQTDSEQRLKSIHKMAKSSGIIFPIIFVLMAIEMIISTTFFSEKPFALMDRIDVITCVVWLIAGVSNIFTMLSYLTFYFKNKSRIKANEPMFFNSLKKASSINTIAMCSVLMLLVGVSFMFSTYMGVIVLIATLIALIASCFSGLFYDKKYSRKQNKRRYILFVVGVTAVCVIFIPVLSFSFFAIDFGSDHTGTVKQGDSIVHYDNYEIPYNFEDAGFDVSNAIAIERYANEDKLITGTINSYNSTAYADINFTDIVDYMSYSVAKFSNSKNNEKYINSELSNKYIDSYNEEKAVAEKWKANKAYQIVSDDETDYLICYDDYCLKISENLSDKTELIDVLK